MRRRRLNARTRGLVRQIAAWCLHYPDAELVRQLPLLREATAELGDIAAAGPLHNLLAHLGGTPLPDAERHYVEVFDVSPRRSLHLTWFVHGDTRLRGGALAELAGIFRTHGYRIADRELPDYLPAMLEFSVASADPGEALLGRFRPAIELLHRKLGEVGTPYAGAVGAVLDAVPRSRETAAVPVQAPTEMVGLQPFLLREGSR